MQAGARWCGLFLTMIGILSACGYRFTVAGPGPVIGGGRVAEGPPVRLALHTLKNNTFEPNLEFKYTQYFRQAFMSAGSATIVDDDPSADFVLDGTIVSVRLPSVAFSQAQTQESRVTVKVAVKVKDRKTGKVRWAQSGSNSAEFFIGASANTSGVASGLQFNRVLQDRALEQAGQGLAEDLADRFLTARDQGKFTVGTIKQPLPDPGVEVEETFSPSLESGPVITPNFPVQ